MYKSIFKRLFLVVLSLVLFCSCNHYDYTNWKKVEIPTDTPLKGTIKIPNEWEFISEDGIVTLLDQENNRIVAKQIFQDWRWSGRIGKTEVDNWDDLTFKSNIDDVDFKNEDYYTFIKGQSRPAYIYSFTDGTNGRLCLFLDIYQDRSYPAYDSKTGTKIDDFYLALMFEEFVNYFTLRQMAMSYSAGGFYNPPKK